MPIDASVGLYRNGTKQCYNLPKDQLRIANLLDLIGTQDGGTDGNLQMTIQKLQWGVVDLRLEQAIQTFQKKQFGFTDGHVDPGEKTIRKLEELAFRTPPTPAPAGTAPTPTGVPNLPSLTPDSLPVQGPGTFETWGPRLLDIASFGLDFLSLFPAIAEFLGVILGTVLAELLSPIIAIISALLSLPLSWRSGDKAANFNGYCSAYWQAMSDMASAFSDKNLDYLIEVKITPPESVPKGPKPEPTPVWPQIPVPQPHMSVLDENRIDEFERHTREGMRNGCKAAYDTIAKMERSPKTFTTQQGGKQFQIVASGKVTLRLLYATTKGGVYKYLQDATNKELKKRGQPEWPVH
jgi:hypothetical protein